SQVGCTHSLTRQERKPQPESGRGSQSRVSGLAAVPAAVTSALHLHPLCLFHKYCNQFRVACFRGSGQGLVTVQLTPRKHPDLSKRACFRGAIDQLLFYARIRESMPPVPPNLISSCETEQLAADLHVLPALDAPLGPVATPAWEGYLRVGVWLDQVRFVNHIKLLVVARLAHVKALVGVLRLGI